MKNVYICTPLKEEKYPAEQIGTTILKYPTYRFFIPQTSLKVTKEVGTAIDKMHLDTCNEVWVFGPIGRDCAWEIGYAQGLGKRVIFHMDESNRHVVEQDWMTFCAGTEIIHL
jgi:hypothetical protein